VLTGTRLAEVTVIVAVAVATGCSASSIPFEEDLGPPDSAWSHPIGGKAVALSQARDIGQLTFTPLVPELPVDPVGTFVQRHPRQRTRASAVDNWLVLVYRPARSWGFETTDTRVVVRENGDVMSSSELAAFAHDNGELVELGRGVHGALLQGTPDGDVLVGRMVFFLEGQRVDITGPAVPPSVVTRFAKGVVAASAS
jgi:hypothetical protein